MKQVASSLSEKLKIRVKIGPKPLQKKSGSPHLSSVKIPSFAPIFFEEFNTCASTIKRLIHQHFQFEIKPAFYQFMIEMNHFQFEFMKDELFSYQCHLMVLFHRFLNARWPKSAELPHLITQQELLRAYMGAVIVSSKLVSDTSVWNVDICKGIDVIYKAKIKLIQSLLAPHEAVIAKTCHLKIAVLRNIIVHLTKFPPHKIDFKKLFKMGRALPPESFEKFQQAFEILEECRTLKLLDSSSYREIELEFLQTLDWNVSLFATEIQSDWLLVFSRDYDRSFSTQKDKQERGRFESLLQNFGQIKKNLAPRELDAHDDKRVVNPARSLFYCYEKLVEPLTPSPNPIQNERSLQRHKCAIRG